MASKPNPNLNYAELAMPANAAVGRQSLVRILFVHRCLGDVERCLYELKTVRFTVSSDVVTTKEQFISRLDGESYDVVVAEYPSPNWRDLQVLDLLHELKKDVPLIFLVHGLVRETSADLILKGAADCIAMDSLGHLPVAIHRALEKKTLREQRDRAEKDLRRSEARYRALVGNQSYGICRCGLDGKFLEVNDSMVRMLGYVSQDEVLNLELARDVILNPVKRAQLLGQSSRDGVVEPLEIEWTSKNHTALKVRLSGRAVVGESGDLEAYELIVANITRQRELEDHLRRQAASDPLTGLANYRRLVDVLDTEIKRSKRTNREFALLFLDMDGLKLLNDRHGHMVGSQALCRLSDVLCSCCRDIDTPSRFGGDEFALVLPETDSESARVVAERICESVAQDCKGPAISVSVGLSVFPHNGVTIESLLCEADAQLYAEKQRKIADLDSKRNAEQ